MKEKKKRTKRKKTPKDGKSMFNENISQRLGKVGWVDGFQAGGRGFELALKTTQELKMMKWVKERKAERKGQENSSGS